MICGLTLRLTSIVLVCRCIKRYPKRSLKRLVWAGRTGRFGRKGISINFVHDKRTWQQMEVIEQATGRQIVRIETNDLDEMEEVRGGFLVLSAIDLRGLTDVFWALANEEGPEVGSRRAATSVFSLPGAPRPVVLGPVRPMYHCTPCSFRCVRRRIPSEVRKVRSAGVG